MEKAYFSLEVQRDRTTLCLKLAGELDWAVAGHVEGALQKARDRTGADERLAMVDHM